MFLKIRNISSKIKRSKVTDYAALTEMLYDKTVIDFNFGRHKDLSTLKSDIQLDLEASVNYHFFQVDKSLMLSVIRYLLYQISYLTCICKRYLIQYIRYLIKSIKYLI